MRTSQPGGSCRLSGAVPKSASFFRRRRGAKSSAGTVQPMAVRSRVSSERSSGSDCASPAMNKPDRLTCDPVGTPFREFKYTTEVFYFSFLTGNVGSCPRSTQSSAEGAHSAAREA